MELPKKPKTNRDVLSQMCLHDLLVMMNEDYLYGDAMCVVEALKNDYVFIDKTRCREHYGGPNELRKRCSECISAYLNEEAK